MKHLLIIVFLLWPALAMGAVGLDNDSSNTCTSCSTLTISHTVGGSGNLLLCSVSHVLGGTPSGVTWNIVSNMSLVSTEDTTGGTLTVWSLASPTTGAHDVVVTMTGAVDSLAGGCVSFTGAGALDATSNAQGGGPSAIINGVSVTVPTDGMAFGAGLYTYGTCTDEVPDTGNTERFDVCADAGGNNAGAFAVSRTTTGTINWTNRPSGVYEAVIGVPINPAIIATPLVRRPQFRTE